MTQLIYCYDAYCMWCYGFSPVMRRIAEKYRTSLPIEVLSGGMIRPDQPKHISLTAGYIAESYRQVENLTGCRFGADYLWHILNPEESDWYPDSTKAAVAMCIFREMFPTLQAIFAEELQYALFYEGRDLCDNDAYRHLLDKYHIDHETFYKKLASEEYAEKANYEFALVKQLVVSGFPAVFLQVSDTKFHQVARGYTDFETLDQRIIHVMQELRSAE
ncbi:MAG: DsbA family protein [Sphingobacteriales bacterium]|nr:MAG: DsbA family protein [Sphingobacteriales bacterium]